MPEKDGTDDKKSTKSVVNKKQKQMMGEEGYDIARDMGKVRPSKDKKDGTSYPPSAEMKKTQKVNKGPSAYERVKKKYGKSVMNVKKEELDLTQVAKSFGGHIIEMVSTLTKVAASKAAQGAITTTAKQVGKETAKKAGGQIVKQGGGQIVKQGGGQIVKQGGGAIVKSGGGQLAKQGGGAIVKSGGNKVVKTGRTFGGFQDKVKTVDAVPVGGEVKKSAQLAKNVKPKSGPTVNVRPLGGEITKKPQGQITKKPENVKTVTPEVVGGEITKKPQGQITKKPQQPLKTKKFKMPDIPLPTGISKVEGGKAGLVSA